jgi:hypothetical protein
MLFHIYSAERTFSTFNAYDIYSGDDTNIIRNIVAEVFHVTPHYLQPNFRTVVLLQMPPIPASKQ